MRPKHQQLFLSNNKWWHHRVWYSSSQWLLNFHHHSFINRLHLSGVTNSILKCSRCSSNNSSKWCQATEETWCIILMGSNRWCKCSTCNKCSLCSNNKWPLHNRWHHSKKPSWLQVRVSSFNKIKISTKLGFQRKLWHLNKNRVKWRIIHM